MLYLNKEQVGAKNMQKKFPYYKYILALIISIAIFTMGFLLNDILTSKKLESLKNIEDNLALNILSIDTQYEVLKEASCEWSNNSTELNKEISDLAEKLSILENADNSDARIIDAKKRYALLLVKDYLLSQRISEECGTKSTFIIYFYKDTELCEDCIKTGAALSSLREEYERLRIYAFDYDLDLPAIKALISIYNIKPNIPALVINKKVHYGLTTRESIDQVLPREIKEPVATSTSTTTVKK